MGNVDPGDTVDDIAAGGDAEAVGQGQTAPERGGSGRWFADRKSVAILTLAAVMATAGGLLAYPGIVDLLSGGLPGPMWFVLLPLFGVAEVLVIHMPTLRNAHTHTLREVPAVAGLAFLAPGEYVTAYVLGAGLALLLRRWQRGVKLAFNLSMFTMEAGVGLAVYGALLNDASPSEPQGWGAAFAAVLITDVLSAVAVTTAISVTENHLDRTVLREALGPGLVAALVNICMALVIVVLVVKAPATLLLVVVVLAVLVIAYRAHAALNVRYSRLQHLYQFVSSTGTPENLDEAVRVVLEDARRVVRANLAELVVFPFEDTPGLRFTIDADGALTQRVYVGATPEVDAWWATAALGEPVLRAQAAKGHGSRTSHASAVSPRNGMAAPLNDGQSVSGVLLVTERSFQGESFTDEDLRLFQTLAAHAAVALDKARLVDRLRRVAAEREHEARHDPLTGLPNRRAFQEAVTELTAAGGTGAVLFLDLDDFKDVNDTLGHDAGDTLLQRAGEHLQAECSGMVARLGGDEFAVLLPGVSAEEALDQAHSLHVAAARPVSLGTFTMVSKASIGVTLIGDSGVETSEVLRQADVAMYEAKRSGNGVQLYRPADGRAVARKLILAADLPAAINERHFVLHYQPQADARTGDVVGVEALLRWAHPTYGLIPPPEVVLLAERVGYMRQLTDAVLHDAIHQRAAWAAAGHPLNISVNVSALDLGDDSLPDSLGGLLRATGTPPAAVTLEITEQGVMKDPDRCLAVLDRLADLGVRLSLDDFGTGHSSLAYLERLPVDEVKIDKSFVQRLDRESPDETVIRSTITLAHDLGIQVVAEGLETRSAWLRVADLGCELVQGYVLARPMPAKDALSWLRDDWRSAGPGDKSQPFGTGLAVVNGSA